MCPKNQDYRAIKLYLKLFSGILNMVYIVKSFANKLSSFGHMGRAEDPKTWPQTKKKTEGPFVIATHLNNGTFVKYHSRLIAKFR